MDTQSVTAMLCVILTRSALYMNRFICIPAVGQINVVLLCQRLNQTLQRTWQTRDLRHCEKMLPDETKAPFQIADIWIWVSMLVLKSAISPSCRGGPFKLRLWVLWRKCCFSTGWRKRLIRNCRQAKVCFPTIMKIVNFWISNSVELTYNISICLVLITLVTVWAPHVNLRVIACTVCVEFFYNSKCWFCKS